MSSQINAVDMPLDESHGYEQILKPTKGRVQPWKANWPPKDVVVDPAKPFDFGVDSGERLTISGAAGRGGLADLDWKVQA